jgi:hypothetical protein
MTAQRIARSVTGWLLLALSARALALGLGDAHVASAIGEPLLATVPLKADAGVELTQDCVRIVPAGESGDSTPALNAARISIDAEHHQLRIESLQPILEPTLRVAVEVGCKERIRREFALLLDPPPVAVAASGPGGGAAQPGGAQPALGLGMAQISAVLGQPLSLKVPVVGAEADSLSAECVHLADPISSEGAPVLRQASIRVLHQDIGAVIEVVTPAPVTEPAVRVTLDVGCREPLRREYAILLGLPALAASNVEPGAAPEKPAPPPKPKRAPRHVAKAPPPIASAPSPREPARTPPSPPPPAAAVAAPAAQPPAPAPRSDRLVLASPQEVRPPAEAGGDSAVAFADQNAQLLKRMDAMSKQVAALEAQLIAARTRELELERRASETRNQWTWSMGGVGGLLLGAALMMAWRQRRPPAPATWEPRIVAPTIAPVTRPATAPHPAAASRSDESMEIGGRATMAPAPTTVPASSEASLSEARHSPITVTELHDTVQVIKELYATVLERNTGATTRPQRALDLDLRTPTGGGSAATPAPAAGDRPLVSPAQVTAEGADKRGFEERFTELPTELGLDLDLSSVLASAPSRRLEAEPSAPPAGDEPPRRAVASPPPASAPSEHPFAPDDRLTTTPTEVAIDIDVGTASGFTRSPTVVEPIDLQLDLSQPDPKGKRREEQSG